MAAVNALGGRSAEAIEWADKGLALAHEHGVENVVRSRQMRGLARIDLGDFGGLEELRDALALSLRLGLGIETGTSYLNLSEMVALFEGLAGSRELADASLEFSQRRGLTHHVMWTRAARLWALYEVGEWDELLAEADDVLRWDRAQGGTQIEVNALIVTASVLAQRGLLHEAALQVEIFLPRAREVADPQAIGPALTQASLVAAARGKLGDAVSLVEEVESVSGGRVEVFGGLAVLVRVCMAAGEPAIAERLVEATSTRRANLFGLNSLTSSRAMLAEAHGEYEEAARLYREAEQAWRRWGSVLECGYALHGLGRCGDRDAAREAAALFERMRATPLSATARAA